MARSLTLRSFVVLYANDILLIAVALVTEPQSLLQACEEELKWLYTWRSTLKKLCVHIGQRYDFKYASTANSYGYTASHMG